jgi:hypothetical protein
MHLKDVSEDKEAALKKLTLHPERLESFDRISELFKKDDNIQRNYTVLLTCEICRSYFGIISTKVLQG